MRTIIISLLILLAFVSVVSIAVAQDSETKISDANAESSDKELEASKKNDVLKNSMLNVAINMLTVTINANGNKPVERMNIFDYLAREIARRQRINPGYQPTQADMADAMSKPLSEIMADQDTQGGTQWPNG